MKKQNRQVPKIKKCPARGEAIPVSVVDQTCDEGAMDAHSAFRAELLAAEAANTHTTINDWILLVHPYGIGRTDSRT